LNALDFTYDFPNGMRADHLSREAIALMKGRIGMLSISAESATQEDVNGPIGKGQPLEAIRRGPEWCREPEVPLMPPYIVGFPRGYVAKARAAFDMKVGAQGARKLVMNITYKCANRCVFCATGGRISAALAWDKIEAILRQHREEGTDQLDIGGGEPTTHPRL